MKKKILVLGTGGTIASKETSKGLAPMLSAEDLIGYVSDVAEYADLETVQICNLDSTDIRPKDWLEFSMVIENMYDYFDGFVLCHGTDTLAYTAAALSYLIQDSKKPIVVTGSQKPIDAEDTDARRNLRDAILVACDDDAHNVVVVFDGKVIAGTRAKKEKSKSYDAFSSINFPNLAVVRDGKIIWYIKDEVRAEAPTFASGVGGGAFSLKLLPGVREELLPYIFEMYSCIIIESFGVGGIPSYIMEEFRNQMNANPETIVIVATQVANEGSDMRLYSVGHDVKSDFKLFETYDMTPESAFAKACWLLGCTGGELAENRGVFERDFYRPINHDLTVEL